MEHLTLGTGDLNSVHITNICEHLNCLNSLNMGMSYILEAENIFELVRIAERLEDLYITLEDIADLDEEKVCIDTVTYNELVKILRKRYEKLHLDNRRYLRLCNRGCHTNQYKYIRL